jgi:hypothetical protein
MYVEDCFVELQSIASNLDSDSALLAMTIKSIYELDSRLIIGRNFKVVSSYLFIIAQMFLFRAFLWESGNILRLLIKEKRLSGKPPDTGSGKPPDTG